MYADDLILISHTLTDLQNLFTLCNQVFTELDLPINFDKCFVMRVGPRFKSQCANITMNGINICWTTSIKYLGIYLNAGSQLTFDLKHSKTSFYKASNAILGKIWGPNAAMDVTLKITSKCFPILTYGIAVLKLCKFTDYTVHIS